MNKNSAYETLVEPVDISVVENLEFKPNPNYEKYLRMHKVLVGATGAELLEGIYEDLRDEELPTYLSAAGSAAVEAALVRNDKPVHERLELIHGAATCLRKAIRNQRAIDETGKELHRDTVMAHRVAIDLATLPLLEGIVFGAIRPETNREVLDDCVKIARSNALQIQETKLSGNQERLSGHIGVGYECNALIGFNRMQSNTWFMVPSLMRADTGYHHRQQTHDLLVVHQKWGEIQSLTPVEIKAAASRRDRERYKALLIRGKMHLSVVGRYRPEHTLAALVACHNGEANVVQEHDAHQVTETLTGMVRDYYAGKRIDEVATSRSSVGFRDSSVVASNYAGISPVAA